MSSMQRSIKRSNQKQPDYRPLGERIYDWFKNRKKRKERVEKVGVSVAKRVRD